MRGVCCKPAIQLPLMGSCEAPLRLLGASQEDLSFSLMPVMVMAGLLFRLTSELLEVR